MMDLLGYWSATVGASGVLSLLFFLILFKWVDGLKRWVSLAFLGVTIDRVCAAISAWFFQCGTAQYLGLRSVGHTIAVVTLLLSIGAILFRNGDRQKARR